MATFKLVLEPVAPTVCAALRVGAPVMAVLGDVVLRVVGVEVGAVVVGGLLGNAAAVHVLQHPSRTTLLLLHRDRIILQTSVAALSWDASRHSLCAPADELPLCLPGHRPHVLAQ